MCEVEFWEVFFMEGTKVLKWLAFYPLVDCQLADLEIDETPFSGFSSCWQDVIHFVGLLFPMNREDDN